MPYNLAAPERDIEDLVVRPAHVFREKQNINVLTGHCVDAIDRENQTVSGSTLQGEKFEVPYDRLLIAAGSAPIVPPLPGFDLPQVAPLKSLEDARQIKNLLNAGAVKSVVIIGMGYIALEMCEALGNLNISVAMVKPNPVFLPWLEPSLADAVKAELESKSIQIHAGHTVEEIKKNGSGLQVVCSDMTLDADMVLVAMGIKPNSEFAENAGLEIEVDRAIAVDRRLQTSDPNIYAAGDCADAYHVVTGEKTWQPLALRANRSGWAVADNVCGKNTELAGVAGTAVFKVFDFEVACTGLNVDAARQFGFEPVENVIKSGSKAHAHPGNTTIWVNMIGDKKTGRLLGVQMVGTEGVAHRINGPAVALHNQMTVAEYSQTDLSYAPPFGPTWDPTLTAANQLLKKL